MRAMKEGRPLGAFMMMAVLLLHKLIIQLHFTLIATGPTSQ